MMEQPRIGIDLGNHVVKVARMSPRDRSAVAQVVPLHFESDMGNRGWLDAVEGAIRLAAEAAGIRLSGASATVLLPSNWVEVRWLEGWKGEMDRGAEEEIHSFVTDRLAQELEDTVWDCWVPGAADSGRVGVVFVSRARSALVGELAKRLRLSQVIGDALFWSHGRLAKAIDSGGNSPIAILDWGAKATWFTAIVRGVPQFCRRLPRIMLEDALRTAAHALRVHPGELVEFAARAAAGRVSDDLSDAWESLLADVATAHVAQLAEELSRTLRYVQAKLPQAFPERIIAIGGGATLEPLLRELAERLAPLPLVPLTALGLPRVLNELTANALACSRVKGRIDALTL